MQDFKRNHPSNEQTNKKISSKETMFNENNNKEYNENEKSQNATRRWKTMTNVLRVSSTFCFDANKKSENIF